MQGYYFQASYRRKPVSNTRKRNANKQQEMDSGLRRNDAYLFWVGRIQNASLSYG